MAFGSVCTISGPTMRDQQDHGQHRRRDVEARGEVDRFHQRSPLCAARIRGSMRPYVRSTKKLASRTASVMISTMAWITG